MPSHTFASLAIADEQIILDPANPKTLDALNAALVAFPLMKRDYKDGEYVYSAEPNQRLRIELVVRVEARKVDAKA